MRYPAPPAPNPSKEMDAVIKQIARYQKGTSEVKSKLAKLKNMRRRVVESIRMHEALVANSKHDTAEASEKLSYIKQRLRDFENQLNNKGKQFQDNMFALEELKEGISAQTEEVWKKVTMLQSSCQDWRFAHQLNNDVCNNARTHAYGAFYRWALVQPLIRIWMATDSQIHRTIYATGHFEGVYEELMAHLEVKDSIEQFGEDHYAVYRETDDIVRTVKQAMEERELRTGLLDRVHVTAANKLQKLVNSCKLLQKEIEQREALRFKLNGMMMELSNALETDMLTALEVCEVEATKPSHVTVSDLSRAVQDGTLAQAIASAGASDPFSADGEENNQKQNSFRGKKTPVPSNSTKDHTENNTALNAVSKLPLLVAPGNKRHSGESNSTSSNMNHINTNSLDGGNSVEGFETRPSMHDSVYAQLPQYDNSAIAYVQSFHAPKRTKAWKWCKQAAPDVKKSIQTLYPVVKGPVELIVEPDDEAPPAPSPHNSPKLKNIPSFRRRAGHSTKHPQGGRIGSSAEFFIRDRASVGSAGMPPEWLKRPSAGNDDEAGPGAEGGASGQLSPGSPTESLENRRKRALKFLLSNRETHYDLLDREVVDAVTVLQMEQARAAAAARRQEELDAAAAGLPAAEDELATHQFRTHQLLTEDYTGKLPGDEESGNTASEEYSLYVSLKDMSALTALTARQAVRGMQSASAGITFATVSKIAEVLQNATAAAVTSRAGTAEVPHRLGYAQPRPPPLVVNPVPPAGSAGAMGSRGQFRSHSNAQRGRMLTSAVVDDSLEAHTASILDAIPIEAQAQDLSDKVAEEFKQAREKVEDWLETHTQTNYKNTKRALVELISHLDMDLHVPLDRDEVFRQSLSDHDDSSVEGGPAAAMQQGRPGSAGSSTGLSFGYGPNSMNMTLKNMLEMSKTLISNIQQNLQEFGMKKHDHHLPDDITLHRRPNSGGMAAGVNSRTTNADVFSFEDDEDERTFDPEDYAFTRTSSPGRASPTNFTNTNAGGSNQHKSRRDQQNLTATLLAQHLAGSSSSWPTKRTLLNSMESIICGELFVIDFFWSPQRTATELIAKYFVSKSQYRQCSFIVTPHMISDLTNTPKDLALHTLFHDTSKVTQAIIASLTNETIDENFYQEIVKAYKSTVGTGSVVSGVGTSSSAPVVFEPHWSLMIIEEMLHPKNIASRRGSISQLYRPSSGGGFSPGSMRLSAKHIAQIQQSDDQQSGGGAVGKREYEFLMHILTMRKKSGELMAYSFPTCHEIPQPGAPSDTNVSVS